METKESHQKEEATCPFCGRVNESKARFCVGCGASLAPVVVKREGLQFVIKYSPAYALLEVHLPAEGRVTAEAGALTYMTGNVEVETRTRTREAGLFGALKVTVLGGETLFINDYYARAEPARIGLVSSPLGDITQLEVSPERGYIVQSAGYIASTQGVRLDTQWQGFTKGLFGQNLFMLKTLGEGLVFINTFGAIDRHVLGSGERLIVDNFHLAALSDTCEYTVRKFGNLKSTILGGEGLVTEVTGPGEVYVQTKNIREFANWIWRFLAPKASRRSG